MKTTKILQGDENQTSAIPTIENARSGAGELDAALSLRAGVSGSAGSWAGVIRQGKRVVWRCLHSHCNRHETSGQNPISAYTCASHVLDALLRPDSTKLYEQWFQGAYFTQAGQARHASLMLKLHRWADTQAALLTNALALANGQQKESNND